MFSAAAPVRKRQKTGAVQDADATFHRASEVAKLLECGSPLPLFRSVTTAKDLFVFQKDATSSCEVIVRYL